MGGKAAPKDCIFCSIGRGESPARVVYEDEEMIAFLDKFPLSRGHTLVVPKRHVDRLTDLPTSLYPSMLKAVAAICARVERLTAHYNVGVNQGALAGQVVFHLHFHVIPRYEHQPSFPRQRQSIADDEAEEVLRALRAA